ncbi:MAG: hypothetical protein ABFD91_02750 [Anaerohalosphaeraceae bacterium]
MRGTYQFLLLIVSITMYGCQSTEKQSPTPETSTSDSNLKMTCHVNFYQDKSVYITEQEHVFNPSSISLQIRSKEPSGRYIWLLQGEHYSVENLTSNKINEDLFNKAYLQAIYYSMISSAELLTGERWTEEEMVKIEGKWYMPYLLQGHDSKIRLMKNKSNNQFDQIIFQKDDLIYQVISYNLRFDKDLNKNLPRTIDIFDATNGLSSKKLLLQVQYN